MFYFLSSRVYAEAWFFHKEESTATSKFVYCYKGKLVPYEKPSNIFIGCFRTASILFKLN